MHVLIIEDDFEIASLIHDYLNIHYIESTMVHNGQAGLDIALSQTFDLIVLDIMLPGIDGLTICQEIRKEKLTPIILLTAKTEEIDKIKGLGFGADDYVTKPFSPNELIARIKSHINRFQALTNLTNDTVTPTWSYNNLTIKPQERFVSINDRSIQLKNKEFELLYFLTQNPNIVFSKEQLFEKIWGQEALGDTATVTVHINRIRDKIELDPSNPIYIETIWGVGYRFMMK